MMFVLAVAAPARATVVFSSFGPGDSFSAGSSDHVSGPNRVQVGNYDIAGQGFTPTQDFYLESIEIAGRIDGSVQSFSLRVSKGIFGGQTRPQPDEVNIIEAIAITSSLPSSAAIFKVDSVAQPLLRAGTLYWFFMVATDDSALFRWNAGDASFTSSALPAYHGHSTGPDASGNPWGIGDVVPGLRAGRAIRVNGSVPVPEPPIGLFVLLVGVAVARIKGRSAES